MNIQTKKIWLPGLLATGLATILLTILHSAGIRPMVVWAPAESPALFYGPWVLSLPFWGLSAHSGRDALAAEQA